VVEQEDNTKKREGTWRTRGMPEVTKSNRRMSFD
jgi:hypothetical protein